MAEAGGPTNQSGLSYQNLIAGRFVSEMLSDVELAPRHHIVAVQSEAREAVDDVVVTYADGHRLLIQAKENLSLNGDAWRKVWSDFKEQFAQPDFRRWSPQTEPDVLALWVETDGQDLSQWSEALRRTQGVATFEVWLDALNTTQRQFWQIRVAPLLADLSPADLWVLLCHVRCEIHTRGTTEQEALRLIPASFNESGPMAPNSVFSLLLARLPADAARRIRLEPDEVRSWLLNDHRVRLSPAPPLAQLREAVARCSAVLRGQRQRFGEGGSATQRHLERPQVREILEWLVPGFTWPDAPNTDAPDALPEAEKITPAIGSDNIAALLDGPGRGKTVVLRDVLEVLESQNIPVLAIKADRQLGDLAAGRALHQCAGVGLPAPVEDVVQWLSRAQTTELPVVVLLDQVDALSLTMARDGAGIEAISTLVARLRGLPGVRVLLACRTFDLNTTPALRSLELKQKFPLPLLEPSEVAAVLEDAGIEAATLAPATRELLRVPLHLDIFLRAIEAGEGGQATRPTVGDARAVQSLQDLYALFWNRIVVAPEALVSPDDRIAAVRAIVDVMSAASRTTAPSSLFQATEYSNLAEAARFLEHEGLLVQEAGGWNFLHQTFFDYAFARFFVQEGRSLSQVVLNSPQGLAERPLLSHVLGYLRVTNPTAYETELTGLGISTFFEMPTLRKHLRRLLREWFGALRAPSEAEWRHARRLLLDPARRVEFLNEADRNTAWFNRLRPAHIPRWLELLDAAAPNDASMSALDNALASMFRFLCDGPEPQEQILTLLRPYWERSERWKIRLHNLIHFVHKWHSPEIVALYGDVLIQFWEGDGMLHYQLRGIAKQRPVEACAVLRRALDLIQEKIHNAEPSDTRRYSLSDIFSEFMDRSSGGLKIDDEVMQPLAQNVPGLFLDAVWPLFSDVITRGLAEYPDSDVRYFPSDACQDFCGIRTTRGVMYRHDFGMALAAALGKALTALARQNPKEFETWFARFALLKSETPQTLALDALRSDPERFASLSWEFLVGDERRLELGEQAFETRRLIRAMVPFWNAEQVAELEQKVLNHSLVEDNLHPDLDWWVGREQWRLLKAVGSERLSPGGLERLERWNAKFGEEDLPEVPILGQSGFVSSPIDPTEAAEFSDEEWLAAMSHYRGGVQHPEFLRGGAEQLGRVLEALVKQQPERFAGLFVEQVPIDADAAYVKAALSGLSESVVPSDLFFALVRRFLSHCGPDVFRDVPLTIARALRDRAADGLPDDLLELMARWVEESPVASEDESFHAQQRQEQVAPPHSNQEADNVP